MVLLAWQVSRNTSTWLLSLLDGQGVENLKSGPFGHMQLRDCWQLLEAGAGGIWRKRGVGFALGGSGTWGCRKRAVARGLLQACDCNRLSVGWGERASDLFRQGSAQQMASRWHILVALRQCILPYSAGRTGVNACAVGQWDTGCAEGVLMELHAFCMGGEGGAAG
jgi:hypothetical protein